MTSLAMEAASADHVSNSDRDLSAHLLACTLTAIGGKPPNDLAIHDRLTCHCPSPCALHSLTGADLAVTIGTPCVSVLDGLATAVSGCMLHPGLPTRAALAVCMRRMAAAMPGKASHLAAIV